MSHIIAKSTTELKEIEELLSKNVPTYRQAYSDRTAWIMACLSELAYLKFNPILVDTQKDFLIKSVSKLIDNKKKNSSLLALIDLLAYDPEEEEKKLISDLAILNIKLEKTFDNNGTQAILVSSDEFYVLAFRGTETTSLKDIKADLKASITQCETGGKIHTGFKEAFDQVSIDIQSYINSDMMEDKPLFMTGHSLGGALATVATKKLSYDYGKAGCYTFGSPRVGNEEWMENIKTPIYRLVNSADPVTMMPLGTDTINFISFILKFVPYVGKGFSRYLTSKFAGYYHAGDMKYVTNTSKGKYEDANLLYSVNTLRRIKAHLLKKLPWWGIVDDHSMTIYRKKLKFIAEKRQNI